MQRIFNKENWITTGGDMELNDIEKFSSAL
jgi:hypothetical protein